MQLKEIIELKKWICLLSIGIFILRKKNNLTHFLKKHFYFRYEGDKPEITEEEKLNEEQKNLDKLLKKIERNKNLRNKQKEKDAKQKAAKKKTLEHRQLKRKIKATIIPVPDNNNEEFIDTSIIENEEDKRKIKKIKLDSSSLEGFTILGAENIVNHKKVSRY